MSIINLETFWDENYYNNPPLTPAHINQAQTQLGVTLPQAYLDLLQIQNGGYTQEFVFLTKEKTSWAEDHVPLNELFGIVVDPTHEGAHNILDTAELAQEWGLPQDVVVFTGEGHWWLVFDYRKSPYPTVTWLDVDSGEDVVIAQSFEAFLSGLLTLEDYEAQTTH